MKNFVTNSFNKTPKIKIQLKKEFEVILKDFEKAYQDSPTNFGEYAIGQESAICSRAQEILLNYACDDNLKSIITSMFDKTSDDISNDYEGYLFSSICDFKHAIRENLVRIKDFCENQNSPESVSRDRRECLNKILLSLYSVFVATIFAIMSLREIIVAVNSYDLFLNTITPENRLTGEMILGISVLGSSLIGAAILYGSYMLIQPTEKETQIAILIGNSAKVITKHIDDIVLNSKALKEFEKSNDNNFSYEDQLLV